MALESRRLLAILVVSGTGGNDTIRLSFDGVNSEFVTKVNSDPYQHWPSANITAVNIAGLDGDDNINLVYSNGVPIVVSAGNGDDAITVGAEYADLDLLPGSDATLNGGAGNDSISVYDHLDSGANSYAVSSSRVDRASWSGFTYGSDIERIFVNSGSGADTFNVSGTRSQTDFTFAAVGVGDTFNLGTATAGMQGILSDLSLTGGATNNVINVNNGADTADRNWLIGTSAGPASDTLSGMFPGRVSWPFSHVSVLTLMCGGGHDTGRISSIHADLYIDTAAELNGRDEITFGSSSSGMTNLQPRAGGSGIWVDNGPGRSIINFDNAAGTAAVNATLDLVGGYNQLTGMAPVTIQYDDNDASATRFFQGTGNDALHISRVGGVTGMTVTNAGGADTLDVGAYAPDLQGISIPVTLLAGSNPAARTTLYVDNGSDTVSRTTLLDFDSATGLMNLTGSSPQPIVFDPTAISSEGVFFIDGEGAGQINVAENRNPLTIHNIIDHLIDASADAPGSSLVANDIVTVGSEGNLDTILSGVSIHNYVSLTSVIASDASSSTAESVTFAVDEGYQGLYLESPSRAVRWYRTHTASAAFLGGSGQDTMNFRTTQSPTILVNSGPGDDTFDLGDLGNGLHSISGLDAILHLDGDLGNDVATFDNTDGPAGAFFVNDTSIVQSESASVTLESIGECDIRTSMDGEYIEVSYAPSYDLDLFSGAGADTFVIDSSVTGQVISINADSNGATGTDALLLWSLLPAPLPNVVIPAGYLGSLSMQGLGKLTLQSTNAVHFTSLSWTSGLLDITHGGFILDTAAQLDEVNALVRSGYNGGDWLGFNAITSSTAAQNPSTRSVAVAQGADLFGSFPAIYRGTAGVQASTVLVGYSGVGPDANQDNAVNFSDLLILAKNYGQSDRLFSEGNFDYDAAGLVNFSDLLTLARRYGASLVQESSVRLSDGTVRRARQIDELV